MKVTSTWSAHQFRAAQDGAVLTATDGLSFRHGGALSTIEGASVAARAFGG